MQTQVGRAKGRGPQKLDEGPQVAPGAAFGHGCLGLVSFVRGKVFWEGEHVRLVLTPRDSKGS